MNARPFSRNRAAGFSMIEVLISVVVLGFGLLALAALQTRIIRSSSETKAQSVALQLAKDKIEDLRSFQTLAGYKALTSSTATESINDNNGNLGGINYGRSWVVTRWAYNPTGKVFESVTPLTGDTPTGGVTPSKYVSDNEYKRVTVTVTWPDADGVTQSVAIEDGIGAISPGDSSKVALNNLNTSQARKPRVLIYNPGDSGGVIPIAVGNGTSTAASNPVPIVTGKNDAVSETQFEVLTYAGTSGNVLAQSRVETRVLHCSCSTADAPSDPSARGYRPTYWNGYRYAPPIATTDKPVAGWRGMSTESDRCTACCRDHRDPPGITGPRFDPWRATHAHYLRSGSSLTLASSGSYDEACRLIRVDGVFRVAADLRNDYFGLLETKNNGDITASVENNRAYVPTASATKNYQDFVLKYMDDRFSNNTAKTYNTALATGTLETTYRLNAPYVSGSDVAEAIQLNDLVREKEQDSKWSHARGMFVDWIEADAWDVIVAARKNCSDVSTQEKRNACVLPYVPFTTINLTELADWWSKKALANSTLDKNIIQVANNAFYDPSNSNVPTRGNVFAGTYNTQGDTAFAVPFITESNSGLALQQPIDTDEQVLSDNQKYSINENKSDPTDKNFFIRISGQSPDAPWPQIGDALTSNSCTAGSPNDYACALKADSNGVMNIKVQGYTKSSTVQVANGCYKSGTVGLPKILDYDVASAYLHSGAAATLGPVSGNLSVADTSVVYFKPVASNDILRINFTGPVAYCPSNYKQEANTSGTPPDSLNCDGNGANTAPQWSSTYVACPSGTP